MQNCIILGNYKEIFMHPKEQIEKLINLGLKQDEIAKVSDVSQSTISRILTGNIENPSWLIASKINSMYSNKTKSTKSPDA